MEPKVVLITKVERTINYPSGTPRWKIRFGSGEAEHIHFTEDAQFAYRDIAGYEGLECLLTFGNNYRITDIALPPAPEAPHRHLYHVWGVSDGNKVEVYVMAKDAEQAHEDVRKMFDPDGVKVTLFFVERDPVATTGR